MSKLYNPTKDTVKIVVEGTEYSVAPETETVDLPSEVFVRWAKTHEFLIPVDARIKIEKSETDEEKPKVAKKTK